MISIQQLLGCNYNRDGSSPEDGFNCYTLASYVRRNLYGLDTPVLAMEGFSADWAEASFRERQSDWEITTSPVAGDLVVMRVSFRKFWHHCGVWLETDQVLHAYEGPNGFGSITASKLPALQRVFAEIGFARWQH